MVRSDFEKVASGLVALARERPGQTMRHTFLDGLKTVIKRDGGMWQLGVWRKDEYPSKDEVETARRAFGVGKGAVPYPKSQKVEGVTWRGAVLSWQDPEVAPVKEVVAR